MNLLSKLLSFGNRTNLRRCDARELQQLISDERLGLADDSVAEADIDVEPGEVPTRHSCEDAEHAAPTGCRQNLAASWMDQELEPVAEIPFRCGLERLVDFEQALAKRCWIGRIPGGQVEIPRCSGLGPEAELHRVAALEKPRRFDIVKEPRQQPFDRNLQSQSLNLHTALLRGVAQASFECLSERLRVRVRLAHARLFPERALAMIASRIERSSSACDRLIMPRLEASLTARSNCSVGSEGSSARSCSVRSGVVKRRAKLTDATRARLDRTGRERALIYKTLVLTGLRKGELASVTVGQIDFDGPVPYLILEDKDEKNRQGSEIPLRADLAGELRAWLDEKLVVLQDDARRRGDPIPAQLAPGTKMLDVPDGLIRIFDRDLVFAGIARVEKRNGREVVIKTDERGRTIDIHALRHTFGTHLCRAGVPLRTAQAAMRHSDPSLTANVYTDPKLLDVAGALEALPSLQPNSVEVTEAARTPG